MTTLLSDPPRAPATGHIRDCVQCGNRYDWRKSTSVSLKMTYCGSLCERADLGYTIEGLLGLTPQGEHPAMAPVGRAKA